MYVDAGEKKSSTEEYDALIYYKKTTNAEYIGAPNEMKIIEITKGKVEAIKYLYLISLPIISILSIYFYDKKQKNNKDYKSNKVGFLLTSACIINVLYSIFELSTFIIYFEHSIPEIINIVTHIALILSNVLIIKRKKRGVYIYLLVNIACILMLFKDPLAVVSIISQLIIMIYLINRKKNIFRPTNKREDELV